MHEKLANTDFCNLEKPDYFEIREKANKFLYGDWHGFSYVLESAFAIVGKVFTLIGIIAIISTMNILIVSIFLLMVLASAFIQSQEKKSQALHGSRKGRAKMELFYPDSRRCFLF